MLCVLPLPLMLLALPSTILAAQSSNPPLDDTSIRQAVQFWLQHALDDRVAASESYGDIRDWNTSGVMSFRSLFEGASSFNEDLSQWDVASATDTSKMFAGCSNFQADVSAWNTQKVRNFSGMFKGATMFRPSALQWNTSAATTMQAMFSSASSFNADLSTLDVAQVTDMSLMFSSASAFQGLGLEHWNVNSVVSMEHMFNRATNFNSDISLWNTASLRSAYHMLDSAANFDQNLDGWNLENAAILTGMFVNTPRFNRVLCWPSLARNDIWQDAAGMFCDSPARLNPCCLLPNDTALEGTSSTPTMTDNAQQLIQQSCCAYSSGGSSVSIYKQQFTCITQCLPADYPKQVQTGGVVAVDSPVYHMSTNPVPETVETASPTSTDTVMPSGTGHATMAAATTTTMETPPLNATNELDQEQLSPVLGNNPADYFFSLGLSHHPHANDDNNSLPEIPTPDKEAVLQSVQLDDKSMTVALASTDMQDPIIPSGMLVGDTSTSGATGGSANVGLLTGLFVGAFFILLGVIAATSYRYQQAKQRRANKRCTGGDGLPDFDNLEEQEPDAEEAKSQAEGEAEI